MHLNSRGLNLIELLLKIVRTSIPAATVWRLKWRSMAFFALGLLLICTNNATALTQTLTPTACSNVAGIGTRTWNNPGLAYTSNNTYATATVDGTTTNYLQCLNYGFTIPVTATIIGITVDVERRSSSTSNGGSHDAATRLVQGGTIGSTDRATATIYTVADLIEPHGGASDLWGLPWTPADINDPNFGTAFAATKPSSNGSSHTISVDMLQITVTYTLPPPPPLAAYSMDQTNWNGTVGEVSDSMGSYPGTARNSATTAVTTPAIPGINGTCRYGVFDNSPTITRGYVELPGFPNLNTDFTITAWIRTTNNTVAGQRVFIDDESNTGGYGLSLGDGGTGRLRFYSRGSSVIILDTPNVIANNTWYFVAGVADITNGVRTIYVYDAAGVILVGLPVNVASTGWGTDNGMTSIGGETNSSGEPPATFHFIGNLDEVLVYNAPLDQAALTTLAQQTHPCSVAVDHYSISHDGTAINCQDEPVTISAHNAGHGVITTNTELINLSTDTGHGDWSVITGTPANLVNSGNGIATYTYASSNNGVVVLGLKDTFVETVDINVSNVSGISTEKTGTALPADDTLLAFAEAGFNFLGAGIADNISTQIGGKSSSVAPGNQLLELQAIKTSDKTGACEAALLGSYTIDLAFECRDPTSCTANQASISGTAIGANNNGAVASYTGVPLNFGATTPTRATFTLTYPEVGRLRLHARYNIPLGSGSPSGNLMLGNSNEFVVRPFGFQLSAAGNPAVSGPGGAVYTSAGTPFNATVRAVLWQAADDANQDGIPEGHNDTNPANNANLADNSPALNFGREVTPETVALSSLLFLPAPTLPLTANDPGLAGSTTVSGFISGSATSAVRFDEVGSLEIAAALSDASYLGIGPVYGRSGVVGRFRPHHFRVVPAPDPPTLTDACLGGAFTYLGQPFTFTVAPVLTLTAENQGNATTRNYDCGGFWKLPEPYAIAYTYTDGAGAGPTLSPVSGSVSPPVTGPTATTDCTGGVSLTISDNFTYSRPALTSPIIPFSANINLAASAAQFTDLDGVCFDTGSGCQGFSRNNISGANLRLGQTVTSNAYGPETATITEPLILPVTIQFYNNVAQWVTNGADSCSQFFYLITPDGSITVNSSPASPVPTAGGQGDLQLWPTADPGPAGGQVRIDYTLPTWLGPNAEAEAFFGIYRGNDRIINWRELVR